MRKSADDSGEQAGGGEQLVGEQKVGGVYLGHLERAPA